MVDRCNNHSTSTSNSRYCFVLDVAHAHQKQVLKRAEQLVDLLCEKADVIVGNVCTPEAIENLCRIGVSGIKVGVGNGAACLTQIVTGCGIPQLSTIIECANACDPSIPICADGGIRNSGDIVKALAAGASSVMIGRLFASCPESAGWDKTVLHETGRYFKEYRGSSTFGSRSPEGKIIEITEPGNSIKDVIKELKDGIQSGMSYCNATNITELRKNTTFRIV